MKKTLLSLMLAAATTLLADESTEALRKEFEAYKQTSEQRIQTLGKPDRPVGSGGVLTGFIQLFFLQGFGR